MAQTATQAEPQTQTFASHFSTPLLISGVRCILGYIVLPFVLPLVGIATGAAFWIVLVLDTVATISIALTLRRLFGMQHPRRFQYLLAAIALVALYGFFLLNDARRFGL
jgi:hypothetical protein